jgi:hypothetical protein
MGYVPNLRLVVPEARDKDVKRPTPRIPGRRLQGFAGRRSLRGWGRAVGNATTAQSGRRRGSGPCERKGG